MLLTPIISLLSQLYPKHSTKQPNIVSLAIVLWTMIIHWNWEYLPKKRPTWKESNQRTWDQTRREQDCVNKQTQLVLLYLLYSLGHRILEWIISKIYFTQHLPPKNDALPYESVALHVSSFSFSHFSYVMFIWEK